MKIPVLRLKNILLTSIQVDLTDEDAIEFQEDLLKTVQRTEADGVIIDITALDVVDSFLARVLNETAVMVKFLGAESVITGMQPNVALTLVEMGREFIGVSTAINLDHGMEKLQALISGKGGG
jgi:rsbT antagonist protein RsbS